MIGKKLPLFFLLVSGCLTGPTQGFNQTNGLDSASFQALRDELDYSATVKKWMIREYQTEKNENQDAPPPDTTWINESGLVRFLALTTAALLIFYLIFLVFRKIKIPEKISNTNSTPTPVLPETLSDPWKEYQWAVQNGNYRDAIRHHFGAIIMELKEKKQIRFEIFKTNYDYLKEIRDRELKWAFKEVSRIYEHVWYGNHHPDFDSFQKMDETLNGFRKLSHEK